MSDRKQLLESGWHARDYLPLLFCHAWAVLYWRTHPLSCEWGRWWLVGLHRTLLLCGLSRNRMVGIDKYPECNYSWERKALDSNSSYRRYRNRVAKRTLAPLWSFLRSGSLSSWLVRKLFARRSQSFINFMPRQAIDITHRYSNRFKLYLVFTRSIRRGTASNSRRSTHSLSLQAILPGISSTLWYSWQLRGTHLTILWRLTLAE